MRTVIFALLVFLALSHPATARCIDPEGVPGEMLYNETHSVFQGCTANGWKRFHGPGAPAKWQSVSTGQWYGCAIDNYNRLSCWGNGTGGGGDVVSNVPTNGYFSKVATGANHACALVDDNSIHCWGSSGVVIDDAPAGTDFVDVASTISNASCAVRTDGSLICWGSNIYNQLSNMPAGNDFQSVKGGRRGFCAVRNDNTMRCWGGDDNQNYPTPQYIMADPYINGTCALLTNGSISCWGSTSPAITDAPSGNNFVHVVRGGGNYRLSCAITDTHQGICWGSRNDGTELSVVLNLPYLDVVDVDIYDEGACFVRRNGTIFCADQGWSGMFSVPAVQELSFSCIDPEGVPGEITYNVDYSVFQGCTTAGWMAFHDPE